MRIAGFTIARNVLINDYPLVEAIQSVLPIVDVMIVLAGDSEDATDELLNSIQDPKIRIYHSKWDTSLKGGETYAKETNRAFQFIDDSYDWAFYIQADEIVHEKYHPVILKECEKYKDDKRVEGLLFKYLHFFGTYDYIGDSRKWYNHEVRIIRNDKSIQSYKDAQGFRKNRIKLNVKKIDAEIHHYGWVKSPKMMMNKIKEVNKFYHPSDKMSIEDLFDFENFDSIQKFAGTHSSVMKKRIERRNWTLDLDVTKKKFNLKDRFLFLFEKKTGKRLFSFKNYKIR